MKLGDIAKEHKESYKGDKRGIPIVGLEHLKSEELRFTDYEVDIDNTFSKVFRKGHILFGRRRAYLKKAAVAEFDGICSGDITVIEAIDGKVEPDLLPFIIQNDALFDFAVSRSAGGLSPRVKWVHLADYEFELPSIEQQRVLADKLWAAYNLKEAYKKMIAATDEMVKAQFIEMFGNPVSDISKWNKTRLGDSCIVNPKRDKCIDDLLTVSFIPMNCVKEDGGIEGIETKAYNEVKKGFTFCKNNDVLFAKITPCMENGKGTVLKGLKNGIGLSSTEFHVLRPINGVTNSIWLYMFTKLDIVRKNAVDYMTGSGGQKRVPASYFEEFMIGIPPIELQGQFAEIVNQADKSKQELKQAIDKIDKVIKSLLQ